MFPICSIYWNGVKGGLFTWFGIAQNKGGHMLIYRRTSILESPAQTLVNTVNCVGVMGKGLAQAFKEREPKMYAAYQKVCTDKLLEPGKLWLWRGTGNWILNFPTKKHWRHPSKIEWIEAGLQKFVTAYREQGIKEISFPRLGCGNGGLNWDDVKPLIENYLSPLDIPIYIHDHSVDVGLPEHLEYVSHMLRKDITCSNSFEGFVDLLHRVIALGGENLVEIGSESPFTVKFKESDLVISSLDASWLFEEDDLHSLWLGLQKGLLTEDRAEWAVGGGGAEMISLLSVLPDVRPVEIQKSSGEPEFAVEVRPEYRHAALAEQSKMQRELSWD